MSERATKTNEQHLDLDAGLEAFRQALQPQEGQFMRGVSVVLNPPKNQTFKPSRADATSNEVLGLPTNHVEAKTTDGDRLASNLLRDAGGRFLSQGASDIKRNVKD